MTTNRKVRTRTTADSGGTMIDACNTAVLRVDTAAVAGEFSATAPVRQWPGSSPWRNLLCVAVLALPLAAAAAPAIASAHNANGSASPQSAANPGQALAVRIGALSEQLFDAADAGRWSQALSDIQGLRAAASRIDGAFDSRFSQAGGAMEQLYSARNHIGGDIAEAGAAATTKDRRWLMNAANTLTLIAGELAQPFDESAKAPLAAKVDTAMFLARRMGTALAWKDTLGYQLASDDFKRIWAELRRFLPPQDGAKARILDSALEAATTSRTPQAVLALQQAAQAIIRPLGRAPSPAQ